MLVNSDFWVWLYCESQYFMEAFAPSFIHSVTTHAKSSGTIRRQGSGEEQSSGPGDRRLDFGSNAVLPMSYCTSHLPFLGPCFLICRRRGYQETFTTCSISITWELVRHVRCDRALQNQNLHSCAQQHPKSTEALILMTFDEHTVLTKFSMGLAKIFSWICPYHLTGKPEWTF